ncbi:hypothetical protein [Streptomyces sp. V4I2]|uniref:hypothetical protein n=1 Tax=Streptomyces sp. V4I2 TaxID=3042280 RepID=UPI002784E6E7|nr:hypothetical protein [Streptomyces sp. V4I2]MDQ1041791.1 hypothetical protein [Streptomyces sp. V4I2]
MSRSFVVAVNPADLLALESAVKAGRDAEDAWLKAAREREGIRSLRGRALREARQRVRTERARLRESGRLAGTRDLVVLRGVRPEMRSRGLDSNWNPVPAHAVSAAGRPVGTGNGREGFDQEGRTLLKGRVTVKLPDDVAERLVRGCYWVSAPAVEALCAWADRWGDGPMGKLKDAARNGAPAELAMMAAAFAERAPAEALREREKLREQIVTTGDVLRAAIRRAR